MSTSTRFATLTLSTVMATLALVQIGTADFALAGKEQFQRTKPHVNMPLASQSPGNPASTPGLNEMQDRSGSQQPNPGGPRPIEDQIDLSCWDTDPEKCMDDL